MENLLNNTVTAFLPVYNEEKRIEHCLISFQWCDEIILLDKGSSDNTVEIAKKYKNVRILVQENTESYSSSEFKVFMDTCKTNWCMLVTASGLMHRDLALRVKEVLSNIGNEYDTISIPYRPYFLGQYAKYSPWFAEYSNKIVRTDSVNLNLESVHSVFVPNNTNIYKIKVDNPEFAFYHLSHESAESMLVRHSRYWRGEINSKTTLQEDCKYILKKTIQLIFFKRTFFKGKDAIALAFSFLSYHMMTYVFKWDKLHGNEEEIYRSIRSEINKSWTSTEK
jgi:glycosyltransferase involved in cell wall biosynthesis